MFHRTIGRSEPTRSGPDRSPHYIDCSPLHAMMMLCSMCCSGILLAKVGFYCCRAVTSLILNATLIRNNGNLPWVFLSKMLMGLLFKRAALSTSSGKISQRE